MSASERALRDEYANTGRPAKEMRKEARAFRRKFFRRFYLPPWPNLLGDPNTDEASSYAGLHDSFPVYKVTPYRHPDLELFLVASTYPSFTALPYQLRFAVADTGEGLRILGHQSRHEECRGLGCSGCGDGWASWNEGNDPVRLLDAIGEPREPSTRFDDPGERYADFHRREP